MDDGARLERRLIVTRIVFGCFEVPGWGGLTTATYRLFETMHGEGHDVHYVNLILDQERHRFESMFGPGCENPRNLANVHSCYLLSGLHEPHPELTDLIDSLQPDRMVGVGDISAYLMKKASSHRELLFLTTGCMQVDRRVPFTEQWAAMNRPGKVELTDRKERDAVEMADLIVTHSPMIRELFLLLYPGHVSRIHPEVFWFAEWIAQDAAEYSSLARPFAERDIDALFIASSWNRPEKNASLVADIASRLGNLSIHLIGDVAEQIPEATQHGFVAKREDLFRIMGRARTVVSPSYFDAAPGILFEASTMGCNIVTSRNCGNWMLCNDELLVTEYSAHAFADATRRARGERLRDNIELFLRPSSYRSLERLLNGKSLSILVEPRDPIVP